MIDVGSVYTDVARDSANQDENGYLSYAMFNRMSRRAELRLLEWLTGDISAQTPPEPYLSQKNKDWASPFIAEHPFQVVNGRTDKPTDYYGFENMYRIGSRMAADCEQGEENTENDCNTPIELLDGAKYTQRCKTYIDEEKPSFEKPISKLVGKKFHFTPSDLGSATLEYYRYPVFAKIVPKKDDVFNDEVIDTAVSTNYEWDA